MISDRVPTADAPEKDNVLPQPSASSLPVFVDPKQVFTKLLQIHRDVLGPDAASVSISYSGDEFYATIRSTSRPDGRFDIEARQFDNEDQQREFVLRVDDRE